MNVLLNAQAKADPAAADKNGVTPASRAAFNGHAGVLRLLQEAMGLPWHTGCRGLSDDEISMVRRWQKDSSQAKLEGKRFGVNSKQTWPS